MSDIKSANVAIIYGSDTGNTQDVSEKLASILLEYECSAELIDITEATVEQMESFDFLLMGIPTWSIGQVQDDWEEFEDELAKLNLHGKFVALFGLGDQRSYGDYFLDALGWLHEYVISANAMVIGQWSIDDTYEFDNSLGLNEEKTHFLGLAIDEDNQFELTDERISNWVSQLVNEYQVSIAA